MASINRLMVLAMGSPPAPLLANGWLSQLENLIKNDAKIYERYMDDIVRESKCSQVEQKLEESNNIHKNLLVYPRNGSGSQFFIS